MEPRDDEKQVEAITSAEVIPDLGKQTSTTTERIGAHFTIAAAGAGLLSDGCEFPCTSVKHLFRVIII